MSSPFPPRTKNIFRIFLTQNHRSRLGYTLCTPESHIIVTRMAFLPKSSRFDIMSESIVNIIFQEKPTAGSGWSDLPRTTLSSELRSDLKFLELRNVLDPHRHYRSDNLRALAPKFSQIGQIIEGPTEYFSSRLPNKERKRTLFEDVLAKEKSTGRFKKKYNEIQASKTSGKKAYYKDLKWKRSGAMRKF